MSDILSDVHDEQKSSPEQDKQDKNTAAVAMLREGCPACGKRPHDAPEGVNPLTGEPHWQQPYCYACGFRPDSTNVNPLTQRFQDFVNFTNEQTGNMRNERGFAPPASTEEADKLRADFAAMRAELDALRADKEQPQKDDPPAPITGVNS